MSNERENLLPPEERSIQAVAAMIVCPEGTVYTVVETVDRPEYGKLTGMRTIPMETMEPGETHVQTLSRLLKEEVGGNIVNVSASERLGIYGINDAAATFFVVEAVRNDSASDLVIDGVLNPAWINFAELQSTWTRAGVAEMLEDYLQGRRNVVRNSVRMEYQKNG